MEVLTRRNTPGKHEMEKKIVLKQLKIEQEEIKRIKVD